MYCVKCGVKLAESEAKCPLCNTPVYYPGFEVGEGTYPKVNRVYKRSRRLGVNFVIAVAFVLAVTISVLCDINLNGKQEWSDVVLASVAFVYVAAFLPAWFRRPSPAVFYPTAFLAAALLLFYIDLKYSGGWFMTFALPVTAFLALIASSVAILCYYLRAGYLYIFGGAFILFAAFFVVLEILIHLTFGVSHAMFWSFYPAVVFFLLGASLIVVAIVPAFRESLRKVFAI